MKKSLKLPPLNAVRAFEASGRHQSFKAAAEELCVTPSAVSRHIFHLEAFLGTALFIRENRLVTLTKEGAMYLRAISGALGDIETASDALMARSGTGPLRIWCPLTFGMRWLIPRLPRFRTMYPQRDVVFTTSLGNFHQNVDATDITIRVGAGNWPGAAAHRLVGIELVPVCSVAFAATHSLRRPADLANVPLLQSLTKPAYWRRWLDAVGASAVDADKGMAFESVSLAYQLALGDEGVALGQHGLIASDLEGGHLVMPFPLALPLEDAFWLTYPDRLDSDPFVIRFRDWLVREAREFEVRRLSNPLAPTFLTASD